MHHEGSPELGGETKRGINVGTTTGRSGKKGTGRPSNGPGRECLGLATVDGRLRDRLEPDAKCRYLDHQHDLVQPTRRRQGL